MTDGVSADADDAVIAGVGRQQLGDIGTWKQVRGDLLSRTLAALQAAGIAIPYRQIDINLRPPQEP